MDTFKRCIIILMFIFKNVNEIYSACTLSLNKDFGSPQPVFLKNNLFLAPNATTGAILLARSDTLLVACTGAKRFVVLGNDTTNYDIVEARCVSNTTLRIGKWQGQSQHVRCNVHPWFTAESTNASCYGGNSIVRVGYRVQNSFHKLYEACFDSNALTTVYVKHQLTPANYYIEIGGSRPPFVGGQIFGKTRIAELYKIKNQRARVNAVLGDDMDKIYLTKNQYLTKGHLAARADFTMRAEQRASFHYVNAAPQWIRGNAGDWAALEQALRHRVHSYGKPVTVYTGTHGVSTLGTEQGEQRQLFLNVDDNNNNVVPVPLYFYKLVHDPAKRTAVGFVSINSPYFNTTMLDRLTFCRDVCGELAWLSWRHNDDTHSFCCTYEEFRKTVQSAPKLNVKGLFY